MKYVLGLVLLIPLAAAVPLVVLRFRGRPAPLLALQSGGVIAVAYLRAVYLGGDFMAMGRFFVVAAPFLALLFALAFARLAEPDGARLRRAWALAVACFASLLLVPAGLEPLPRRVVAAFDFRWHGRRESEVERWAAMKELTRRERLLGRVLAGCTQPGESMVRDSIGAVGYETELFLHDRYGLVDREVARRDAPLLRSAAGHDKRAPLEFFLDRRPTYLGASIGPAGAPPDQVLPRGWLERPDGPQVRIERHPLAADAGFPRPMEVRLLRLRWDS